MVCCVRRATIEASKPKTNWKRPRVRVDAFIREFEKIYKILQGKTSDADAKFLVCFDQLIVENFV